MKPVFIIGAARSGSRIYLSLFNFHTEIDMIEEPHIFNPRWLRPDFVRSTKRKLSDLKSDKNIDKLMDLMCSGYYYGYFWESFRLDREPLKNNILKSDRSFRSIFKAILEESMLSAGKTIPGAKYPVHLSFVPTLLEWFPECKIIHIIRDPRAFFSSQIYKYARQSTARHKIKRIFLYLPMLAHAIIQFVWSLKVYERHKHRSNYYLSRYEDIVQNPLDSIKKLCNFLEIEFHDNMLNIPVIDSSYGQPLQGISEKSLNRWRTKISPITARFIKLVANKYMKKVGYN